jgi:DNA-binding PadR family transcriptional regulator
MEGMAWIRSRHEEDSQGPPRRVYELAPEGEIQLAAWVEDLRRTQSEIGLLLEAYDKNGTTDK